MARHFADGASGSSGNIVFYVRNGVQCSRTKSSNFKDAKTPGQLAHREKMRRTARFVKKCIRAIRIGYQDPDKDSSSNEIRSFIMKNCFVPGETLPKLDYSKVAVSRGNLVPPRNTTLTVDGSNVTITWENITFGNESIKLSDKIIVLFYSEEYQNGFADFKNELGTRKDLKTTIRFSPVTTPLHAWMFFSNSDMDVKESRNKISDSVYLGVIDERDFSLRSK